MHKGDNAKEMIYLLNKVKGVVTNNSWGEGLCTYYAINALTFLVEPQLALPQYEYFRMKPQRYIFSETGPIKYTSAEESREVELMNQVVDHIHFLFKL